MKPNVYLKLSDVTRVPKRSGRYALIKNCYWIIVNESIIIYQGYSMQCNSNKNIANRIASIYENSRVELIETVFLPSHNE